MINKNEFDLLLQEISQIENKLVEIKLLEKFEKASEYENTLKDIKEEAKKIELDKTNSSDGFDDLALKIFSRLIYLDSEIDYFVLKSEGIIEGVNENKIDAETLEKTKKLIDELEKHIDNFNKSNHNPIEEIENEKFIAKQCLEIILLKLQAEGVIDFSKIFKYCKKDFLVTVIKEIFVEGAKEEFRDEIKKHRLIEYTKNMTSKDLFDYKIWQQILIIRNINSRDDHIEILNQKENDFKNENQKDNKKEAISDEKNLNNSETQEMDIFYEESLIKAIKTWFEKIKESTNQKKLAITWLTSKGPAFKAELDEYTTKYSSDRIDKDTIEKTKKLTIASNGVGRYNFEKNSKWKELKELEFIDKKNSSNFKLSPDKTYNCIGSDSFSDCQKLEKIELGNIEMIGERAFKNCTSISEITFPKSIINVGEDAFCDCTNLKKAVFLGNLQIYILGRPQNIINYFKNTNLEELVFVNVESAFDFAITDCPHLKSIIISSIPELKIPFKVCKYRFGRREGIVSFVGEKSLSLWKKRNRGVRFFELTEEEKQKYENTK